jgi:hypothetical protein
VKSSPSLLFCHFGQKEGRTEERKDGKTADGRTEGRLFLGGLLNAVLNPRSTTALLHDHDRLQDIPRYCTVGEI